MHSEALETSTIGTLSSGDGQQRDDCVCRLRSRHASGDRAIAASATRRAASVSGSCVPSRSSRQCTVLPCPDTQWPAAASRVGPHPSHIAARPQLRHVTRTANIFDPTRTPREPVVTEIVPDDAALDRLLPTCWPAVPGCPPISARWPEPDHVTGQRRWAAPTSPATYSLRRPFPLGCALGCNRAQLVSSPHHETALSWSPTNHADLRPPSRPSASIPPAACSARATANPPPFVRADATCTSGLDSRPRPWCCSGRPEQHIPPAARLIAPAASRVSDTKWRRNNRGDPRCRRPGTAIHARTAPATGRNNNGRGNDCDRDSEVSAFIDSTRPHALSTWNDRSHAEQHRDGSVAPRT